MQNICHQLFEQLDIECAPLFTSRACNGDKIAATLVPREKEGSGLQKRPAHELIRPPTLPPCREDPLLEIAVELEKIATSDEYFVKRGLYPNVRPRAYTALCRLPGIK